MYVHIALTTAITLLLTCAQVEPLLTQPDLLGWVACDVHFCSYMYMYLWVCEQNIRKTYYSNQLRCLENISPDPGKKWFDCEKKYVSGFGGCGATGISFQW